ncbi:hypothetical protein BQ8420_05065 [Nocardiopsis sp. JB363]|nr:hypothetical protein BQ8420_05065 [Nocardiopsis sp. JB363]
MCTLCAHFRVSGTGHRDVRYTLGRFLCGAKVHLGPGISFFGNVSLTLVGVDPDGRLTSP